MAAITFTAAIIAAYRPKPLLFFLAVFSFYSAFSGYRALSRKKPGVTWRAAPWDWAGGIVTVLVSGGLLLLGLRPVLAGSGSVGWVPLALGSLGVWTAGSDLRRFTYPDKAPSSKVEWLFDHIGGMVGAYIAVMTAFLVVNFDWLPGLVGWLGPTVVGIPLIAFWRRTYRKGPPQLSRPR